MSKSRAKPMCRRGLLIIILILILVPSTVFGQTTMEKIDNLNHVEWGNYCLHALDVTFTTKEIKEYKDQGTLGSHVLKNAQLETRRAPDYNLSNVNSTVDTSKIKAKASSEGYSARIQLDSGEYIDILVYIKAPAVAEHSEKPAKKSEAKQIEKETKAFVIMAGPTKAGITVGSVTEIAILLIALINLIPYIIVRRWYRDKRKNIERELMNK